MTQQDLTALVAPAGPVTAPPGTRAVPCGAFTALLLPRRARLFGGRGRKALAAGMVARLEQLEALMTQGTVLPCLPGTRLDPADLPRLLAANAEQLAALVAELAGRQQFQLTVSWDPQAAARRFDWPDADAAQIGTERFAATIRDLLDPVLRDRVDLPRAPDMVLNAALLVEATAQAGLDAALARIDAHWPEGLRIRQVGPTPALSFASLGLRGIRARDTRAARALLGVDPDMPGPAIATARRAALMAAAPADRTRLIEAAEICAAARRAGADSFPLLFRWSEGRAAPRALQPEAA